MILNRTDKLVAQDDAFEEPKFNFSHPETLIFSVIEDPAATVYWKGFHVENHAVIGEPDKKGRLGALSYDEWFGCGMEFWLSQELGCPGVGVWAVMATGEYISGDRSYGEDDDFKMYFGDIRPATEEEKVEVE